jgi:hypothetical protein
MTERLHSPHKYLFWGLVFLLGGGLWRLSMSGWFELSWRVLLPGALIVFGLALLISGFVRRRPARPSDSEQGPQERSRP